MAGYTLLDDPKGGYQLLDEAPKADTSFLQSVWQGAGNLAAGAVRGAGSIGATLLTPVDAAARALGVQNDFIGRTDRREGMDATLQTLGAEPDSLLYKSGKAGGEIAGTAGAGGALANGLRLIPRVASAAPAVLDAIGSAGMSANGLKGATGVTARTLGGAINGGVTAGLVNPEDAGTGAVIGGVLPPAVQAVGQAGQYVGKKYAERLAEELKVFNRNAPKNETVRQAVDAGYVIPPNMVNPSLANQAIESVSGKQATQQIFSAKNEEVTAGIARKALGLAQDAPLTQETMGGIRANAGKVYEQAKGAGTITADPAYFHALDDIAANYKTAAKDFPSLGPTNMHGKPVDVIGDMVQGLKVNQFDSSSAIDAIKVLRDTADKAFSAGDKTLGRANRAAAEAMEGVVERHLQAAGDPELFSAFKDARKMIAKSYTVGRAINDASGTLDARVLGRMYEKQLPLSDGLDVAARFASAFPTVAKSQQQVGSPAAHNLKSMASALMGGSGGGLGYAIGGPALAAPAAALSAAIPFIAPAAARSMMLREGVQQGLVHEAPQASKAAQLAKMLVNPELQQFLLRAAPANASLAQ